MTNSKYLALILGAFFISILAFVTWNYFFNTTNVGDIAVKPPTDLKEQSVTHIEEKPPAPVISEDEDITDDIQGFPHTRKVDAGGEEIDVTYRYITHENHGHCQINYLS